MRIIILLWPVFASIGFAADPWPAESLGSANNLTSIEGAGTNDFWVNLSGAVWNPTTSCLWVCRNSGSGGNGGPKFWALNTGWAIDTKSGQRGEWNISGDLESITFADFSEEVVYVIIEDTGRIREYDVTTYGTATLNNEWNVSANLPVYVNPPSLGPEGITFVPDAQLTAAGFVDQNGDGYTSQNGMGGLMFVAHQNEGHIYVFDLDRSNSTYDFVGAYLTGGSESAGIEFEREANLLYVFHGAGVNQLEILNVSSSVVGSERKFDSIVLFDTTGSGNMEGIAVVPPSDCAAGHRSFFLTIDGGGADSLFWFDSFACLPAAMVSSVLVRKSCDLSDTGGSFKITEPRVGGITHLRIGFDVPPGSGSDWTLQQATCAAPTFVAYSGSAVGTGSVSGTELAITFSPALENARTYRVNFGVTASIITGQQVDVAGLVGDVNGDGATDATDRSQVVAVWTGSGFSCAMDLDSTSATDATDSSIWMAAMTGESNCAP